MALTEEQQNKYFYYTLDDEGEIVRDDDYKPIKVIDRDMWLVIIFEGKGEYILRLTHIGFGTFDDKKITKEVASEEHEFNYYSSLFDN